MIEILLQAERLLLVGLVDQAEQLYSRVAAQDPQNAIAVTGLARVAVERGDDVRAHELAARALTIDPDNAAAVRLEARMREVLEARSAPAEATRQAATGPTRPPLPDASRPASTSAPPGESPAPTDASEPLLRRLFGRR